MIKKLSWALIACLIMFCSQGTHAFGASTTMNIAPASGSFGKQFSVAVTIEGHGDKFNAAQATVTLSQGLAIKDLVFGDCNFSFLKTPSAQSPSFAGVILSTYSTKCTVYTLTLVPTAKTEATIALSKASVRRYGDAANVLSATQDGSYTLTAALPAPQIQDSKPTANSQNGLYTLNVKVLASERVPVVDSTVLLSDVSDKKTKQSTTDDTGAAHFANLKSGIYDAVVKQSSAKVAETIINISGQSHTLNFSINIAAQQNNHLLKNSGAVLGMSTSSPYFIVALLGIGVILGTALTFILLKIRKTRSMPA